MTLIFGIFIIIVIILADTRHLGFIYGLYDFPFGDKVGHFILFGLLSLFINLSIKSHDIVKTLLHLYPNMKKPWTVIKTSLILALFVGVEEFSQRWFPSRTSDRA